MINKKDLNNLEKLCKEAYEDSESIIHGWGHAYRVAEGAKWLVKMKDKPKEDQELAYVAGLLHDIVRPIIDEEKCHAEASAEKAKDILIDLDFQEESISKICKAVKDHRYPREDWDSTLHQSVFLADEIFEQMGAYMDFRGCIWVGEVFRTGYNDFDDAVETALAYYDKAFSKLLDERSNFLDRMFPEFTVPIVSYQLQWNEKLRKDLKNRENWTEDMVERLVDEGKNKKDFKGILINFETHYPEQERWKEEMMSYIDGDLVSTKFETMLKNRT